MQALKNMIKDIWEELEGAEHYASIAHKLQHEDPTTAKKFEDMALQEIGHAEAIWKMAHDLANRASGDLVEAKTLKVIVDWEREKITEKIAQIKRKLSGQR